MNRSLYLFSAFTALAAAIGSARAADAIADAGVGVGPGSGTGGSVFVGPASAAAINALLEYAKQHELTLVFKSGLIEGRQLGPLQEHLPPELALRECLDQADLELVRVAKGTYAIVDKHGDVTASASRDFYDEAPPRELLPDTIVVTAAMAQQSVIGSQYLTLIDHDLIDLFNVANVSEVIYDLPGSLSSITAANTALFGASAGLNLADLRGLGPARTGAFLNGRPTVLTSGGNDTIAGVDLNMFAPQFLEKIEVNTSAPGGSRLQEYAGGSLNFVQRASVAGVEATAQFGLSQEGDALEYAASVIGGRQFMNSRLTLSGGVSFVAEEGLVGADREETSTLFGYVLNGRPSFSPDAEFLPGFGGSTFGPNGRIRGITNDTGLPLLVTSGNEAFIRPDGLELYTGAASQLYNWSLIQNSILPSERASLYVRSAFDIDNSTSAFLDVSASFSDSDTSLSPVPGFFFRGPDENFGGAVRVPITNPFVTPEAIDFYRQTTGQEPTALIVERRYTEIGPRQTDIDRANINLYAGVTKAGIFGDADLEVFYRFGWSGNDARQTNIVDIEKLAIAVDPAACVLVAGCEILDPFGTSPISAATADFYRAPPLERTARIIDHELAARLATPLRIGEKEFDIRLQGSIWQSSIELDAPQIPSPAPLGAFIPPVSKGDRLVSSISGDIKAPVLEIGPLGKVASSLSFNLARHPETTIHNLDVNLDWSIGRGVTLFGGAHWGERAPNMVELFFKGDLTEGFYSDPCAPDYPATATIEANCASGGALGVPEGFRQTKYLTSVRSIGSPLLQPERNRIFRGGLSYSPTEDFGFIPGNLLMHAEWRDIVVSDVIQGQESALLSCYNSPDLSSPACGLSELTDQPFIERDPITRQVSAVNNEISNGGQFEWRGLDLEVRYALEPSSSAMVERLWLSAFHTYTDQAKIVSPSNQPDRLTGLVDYPSHRSLISVGVDRGPLSVSVLGRRRGTVRTDLTGQPRSVIPAIITADLSLRARLSESAALTFTMENALDRDAPVASEGGRSTIFAQHYDLVGRTFSVSLRTAF